LQFKKMKSIISGLHMKFAERSWNETFQLVRRCMVIYRFLPFASRLEMIAKQQGLGFHITDASCYLTADLFYLEAVLMPCGGVEEVKVALHGGLPVVSELFYCLLTAFRSKDFPKFSMKLGDLFNQYNIPGDKYTLIRSALFHVSCLMPVSHFNFFFFFFYLKPLVQAAQVTVGLRDETHQLQMASVILQPPQLDAHGSPVFKALDQTPCEPLPACFLLKLQPPIPMMLAFVHKLGQITGLPTSVNGVFLFFSHSLSKYSVNASTSMQPVPLPGGVMHRYVFPGAAWEAPARQGAVVDNIPFTHPSHVPAILDLLRHQCAINTLLTSLGTSHCENPGIIGHMRVKRSPFFFSFLCLKIPGVHSINTKYRG
uniref:Mediator of RNA polymerase II transcription subunit 1 n=1 Tax=Sphaeramia orbicularis TaxID=375764 RepID=A0A672Z0S1_9TELE